MSLLIRFFQRLKRVERKIEGRRSLLLIVVTIYIRNEYIKCMKVGTNINYMLRTL
jgi:hypothetical protein